MNQKNRNQQSQLNIAVLEETSKENLMKNYLDEIYTVPEFKRDNSALTEQAEKALLYLKVRYPNSHNDDFVVIEVEGYNCIAYLTDEFSLYVLGKHIAPFDKDRIYPLQGLVTVYTFQRY